LDKELGWKDEVKDLYCLEAPGHHRYDKDRTVHKLDCIPVHELLAEEVSENPGLVTKLATLVKTREWTSDYYENPIVTAHPDEPVFRWASMHMLRTAPRLMLVVVLRFITLYLVHGTSLSR